MKSYWRVELYIHALLTSALGGGEWSASRRGRLIPRERAPVVHWIVCWVGHRSGLDAVVKRKITSPWDMLCYKIQRVSLENRTVLLGTLYVIKFNKDLQYSRNDQRFGTEHILTVRIPPISVTESVPILCWTLPTVWDILDISRIRRFVTWFCSSLQMN